MIRRMFILTIAALFAPLTLTADEPPGEKRPVAPEVDLETMIAFDGGAFQMGQEFEQPGRYGDRWFIDQTPAHEVEVPSFLLDRDEVTVTQFATFLTHAAGDYHHHASQPILEDGGTYRPIAGSSEQPMRSVTWQAAEHYCRWAGKRLPTEAEWEFAAAGVEGRVYPWGEDGPDCGRTTHYAGASYCEGGPLPVGSKSSGATPDGVHDMAGNVAEWTADEYARYGEEPTSGLRVVRGGGFLEGSRWLRTRARWGADPHDRSANIGFRCARDADAEADDALRGALDVPDEASEPSVVPYVELPTMLAEGFVQPVGLARIGDAYFVLDAGRGELLEVDAEGGEARVLLSDLDAPGELAASEDAVYFTEPEQGTISAYVPGADSLDVLVEEQGAPQHLTPSDDGLLWVADSTLRQRSSDGTVTDLAQTPNATAVALTDSVVYVATDGGGDPASTAVLAVPRDGGEATTVLDRDTFGNNLYPSHLSASSAEVHLIMRYRSFPNNGWLCQLVRGEASCLTYGPPPRGGKLRRDGSHFYWVIRNAIVRYEPGAPTFEFVTPWARPGAFLLGDGGVVWADQQAGRLYEGTASHQ